MPYSGASDSSLPSNVKKLSPKKRRQWIHVYESARKRGFDEGRAFAQANGVVGRGKSLDILDKVKALLAPSSPKPFILWKDNAGRMRFFGRPSNVFRDKQNEIITSKAHEEYVKWVDESRLYPELWLWHTKGSRFGKVDWVEFADGVLSMSGLIDEGKEELAQKVSNSEFGMSHGFKARYNDHRDVVWYRDFEISSLPVKFCANEWTDLTLWKEEDMAFSPEKKKTLVELGVDESTIKNWEDQNKALGEKLKGLGVAWKEDESEDDEDEMRILAGAVAAQTTAINALVDRVTTLGALEERVASVEKSFEDKVHDAFTAEIAKLPQGLEASKSKDNVVKDDDTQGTQDMKWFFEQVVEPLAKS